MTCDAGEGTGLLKGVNVSSGKYFTPCLQMDTWEDVEWLREPGLFWEAATKDAAERNITTSKYLEDLGNAMSRFKKSDVVHDREEFYSFLDTIH